LEKWFLWSVYLGLSKLKNFNHVQLRCITIIKQILPFRQGLKFLHFHICHTLQIFRWNDHSCWLGFIMKQLFLELMYGRKRFFKKRKIIHIFLKLKIYFRWYLIKLFIRLINLTLYIKIKLKYKLSSFRFLTNFSPPINFRETIGRFIYFTYEILINLHNIKNTIPLDNPAVEFTIKSWKHKASTIAIS
jgi:hypothetical protein